MSSTDLLIGLAVTQAALFIALLTIIVVTRWIRGTRQRRLAGPREESEGAIQAWILGTVGLDRVLACLRRLPRAATLDLLVQYAARTPPDRWRPLAQAVSQERWAARIRAGAKSRSWRRRLDAGHLLTVAARPKDVPILLRLLADPHPAVVIAVIGSLERVQSAALDAAMLDRLATVPRPVQAYATAALQRARTGVVPMMAKLLKRRDLKRLGAYVDLAGHFGDPALRAATTALADHGDFEVRTAVARALAHFPHEESVAVLRRLAADKAWQARAQAIQALVKLEASDVPLFQAGLRDSAWWVRLRAALALVRAGAPGRNALLAAEIGADAFARDMARFVLGLSPGALAEFQR